MECGDLSPLFPLSIRDLFALELFLAKRDKAEFEQWKIKLEDELRRHKDLLAYLLDIRKAQLDKLPFDRKTDRLEYLDNLPSVFILGENQPKKSYIGKSKGAKRNEDKASK